jgi:hypothetical protein
MSRKHRYPEIDGGGSGDGGLDGYEPQPISVGGRKRWWPRFKFWQLIIVAVMVGWLVGWLLSR